MAYCNDCQSTMYWYRASGLGHLMGAIPQQLPPVQPGAPFQFGFNETLSRSIFLDPTAIAGWLETAGLSYNTVSSKIAGALYPFIGISGNSNVYWESGSDFAAEIYNTIVANNFSIDPTSIQFTVEPYYPSGYTPPPTTVGTPAPGTTPPGTTPPGTTPPPPPGQCDWDTMSFGDYVACELGIKSAIGGVAAGASGALIGVGVLTLLAVVLLKR